MAIQWQQQTMELQSGALPRLSIGDLAIAVAECGGELLQGQAGAGKRLRNTN
jgi:hypothetical protein